MPKVILRPREDAIRYHVVASARSFRRAHGLLFRWRCSSARRRSIVGTGRRIRRTSKGTYRSDDDAAFSMALEVRDADDETASVTRRSGSGVVAEVVLRPIIG